jgi:prepilin-type N-terminal cleavage/methylation domain-containing protein
MKILHKKAFSLIEISVVILIIGMLIAGISQGIDLYQDMRLATARSLTLNSRVNRIEDLTMWFEATSEKSFEKPNPNDGDRIALWKNINFKLSNRIDVTQVTQDSKPFYVKNAINNIPALRFNNGQFLTASSIKISEIVSSDQVTVFMVQNNFSGDNTTSTFGWNSGDYRFLSCAQEGNMVLMDFGNTLSGLTNFRITTATLTNFLNQNKIITFVKNGLNGKVKINSALLTNSLSSNTIIDLSLSGDFSIGKYPPANNDYYFFGYIGELIIFKKALTDAEINDVEKYLSKKWSIKIN